MLGLWLEDCRFESWIGRSMWNYLDLPYFLPSLSFGRDIKPRSQVKRRWCRLVSFVLTEIYIIHYLHNMHQSLISAPSSKSPNMSVCGCVGRFLTMTRFGRSRCSFWQCPKGARRNRLTIELFQGFIPSSNCSIIDWFLHLLNIVKRSKVIGRLYRINKEGLAQSNRCTKIVYQNLLYVTMLAVAIYLTFWPAWFSELIFLHPFLGLVHYCWTVGVAVFVNLVQPVMSEVQVQVGPNNNTYAP